MLVIMENRYVAALFKALFNFKAAGSGNVFEVYSTETAGNQMYGVDNIVDIV